MTVVSIYFSKQVLISAYKTILHNLTYFFVGKVKIVLIYYKTANILCERNRESSTLKKIIDYDAVMDR